MARKLEPVAFVGSKSLSILRMLTDPSVAEFVWGSGLASTKLGRTLITGKGVNYPDIAPSVNGFSLLIKAILSGASEAVCSALYLVRQSMTILAQVTRTGKAVYIQPTKKPEIRQKLRSGSLPVWREIPTLVNIVGTSRTCTFITSRLLLSIQSFGMKWRTV